MGVLASLGTIAASVTAIVGGVLYLVKRFFPPKTLLEQEQEAAAKITDEYKKGEETGRPG